MDSLPLPFLLFSINLFPFYLDSGYEMEMGHLQHSKYELHTHKRQIELFRLPLQRLPNSGEFHINLLLLRKKQADRQGKDSGKAGPPEAFKQDQQDGG